MGLITTFTVFWTCYTVLVIFMIAYSYFRATLDFFKDQRIRGPSPTALVGNWWNIWNIKIHELDLERYDSYGRIFGTFDGRTPNAFIGEPKILKKILEEDFAKFRNRKKLCISKEKYLNLNLAEAVDGEWESLSSSMSAIFTNENTKKLGVLMNESIQKFTSSLPEFALRKEINLATAMVPFINFAIGFCGFGMKINTKGRYSSPFAKAITPNKIPNILLTIHSLYPRLGKLLQLIFPQKYKQDGLEYFTEIANNILKSHKSGKESSNRRAGNLMDLLLRESAKDTNKYNPLKDDNMIIGQIIHLLLTGFETNYLAICLTIHCLALKQSVQKKLREEIRNGMAQHKAISPELIRDLPYLEQCIQETLRLYPPIVRTDRVCNEFVSYKNWIQINKGCIVTVPIYAIHRDPEFYKNPNVYDPQRFNSTNKANRDPYTYLPFGIGPRKCFGMQYAMEFCKLTICHLLLSYRFFPISSTVDPPEFCEGSLGFLKLKKMFVGIEELKHTN